MGDIVAKRCNDRRQQLDRSQASEDEAVVKEVKHVVNYVRRVARVVVRVVEISLFMRYLF